MGEGTSRRDFMQTAIMTATAATATSAGLATSAEARVSPGVPTRPLGSTGVNVSMLCLGGWHIGAIKEKPEAVKLMHAAIHEGITFFDNAWDYHNGGSELVMGEALGESSRRDKVFLMTKNCERDYAGSMKCLDESLKRLRTDRIDLWQFHEMVYDNDPDWVFEKGGLRAALEARKAGKVRFIGFTGHKHPDIHLKMLNKPHAWDAAQMPINVMDAHYRSFEKQVVPVCQRKKIAVIGMKSLGGGYPRGRFPSHTGLRADELIRYALGQPISSLVVGMISMEDLKQNVAIARSWKPMSASEKQELLARAKPDASDGRHELFKSTQEFDGPHHRKQHGFG